MEFEHPGISTTANVVVVDDEPMLADLLAEWVKEKWSCKTVNQGSKAIDTISQETDIVLLDRQIPDLPGEEVLQEIRDDKLPVQVMMVSGVEPDFDIIDLPFDDYLQKPVDRPTLQEKIEQLLLRSSYHPDVQKFFLYTAKLDLLETVKSPSELADNEQYLSLKAKADELRQEASATLGRMTQHVEEFHDVNADD